MKKEYNIKIIKKKKQIVCVFSEQRGHSLLHHSFMCEISHGIQRCIQTSPHTRALKQEAVDLF